MVSLEQYRATEEEKSRTEDLIRILPRGRDSVLDVGARDGYFSKILRNFFPSVTAIDLQTPAFDGSGIVQLAGDVTNLDFADDSFDCIFCAEVLEHVPQLQQACNELVRVARHEIVIGVPYKQDIRVGRTTCAACGLKNPPWGHVNWFDEERLLRLFSGLKPISTSFVGTNRERTNLFSIALMDLAGNPWGTYEQQEGCIHCGAQLLAPVRRAGWQRLCSGLALALHKMQGGWTRPHGNWIHMVFSKE